jgi:hypothetical protein
MSLSTLAIEEQIRKLEVVGCVIREKAFLHNTMISFRSNGAMFCSDVVTAVIDFMFFLNRMLDVSSIFGYYRVRIRVHRHDKL